MVEDVVARFQKALGNKNFDVARGLLRDDLRFTGPFEELQGADAYLKTIQGLFGIVRSIEVKHVSSAGDEVVVLYDMITDTPAGTQLICEWYGVDDGRIAWIRALFDSAAFACLHQER